PFSPWSPVPGPVAKWVLPTGLAHARQLAAVRHLAQTDPAQAELAEHRVRTAAPLAPVVTPDLELRLGRRLDDEGFLGHFSSPCRNGARCYASQFSLNGKPRSFS